MINNKYKNTWVLSYINENYKNNCSLISKYDNGGILKPDIQLQLDELIEALNVSLTPINLPQISIINKNDPNIKKNEDVLSFGDAFKSARKLGLSTFKWNGELYTTLTRGEYQNSLKEKTSDLVKLLKKQLKKTTNDIYYTSPLVTVVAPRKRITTIELARNFLWGELTHNYNNLLDFPITLKGYNDTSFNNLAKNQSFIQKGNSILYKTDKNSNILHDKQIEYLNRRDAFYDLWRKTHPEKLKLSLSFFKKRVP